MPIKPLKPRKIANTISVFDIETGSDGSLLDIGYKHGSEYRTFKTWLGFIQHIDTHLSNGDERLTVLWAHNGGKFDSVALVMEIFHNQKIYDQILNSYTAMLINGSILELNLHFKNSDEHVLIRDSFRLFPMSLQKVLESLKLSGKNTVPDAYKSNMEVYKKKFPRAYYDYLKQDCYGLAQALEKFRGLVNDIAPIGDLPLSLGSLALAVYRTEFMSGEIETPNRGNQDFAEPSYSGGRTEYFGNGKKSLDGLYHHCNYYDYNSMYPAIMQAGYFPNGQGVRTKQIKYLADGALMPGCYKIEFVQTGGHIPLLRGQLKKGKKTKEHVWEGAGTYTSDEVVYLQKIGATVKIIDGLVYPDSQKLFSDFVDVLYTVRQKSRESGDEALVLTVKLLLNNLYGKFGQREEGEELAFLTFTEISALKTAIESGTEQDIIEVSLLSDCEAIDETGKYACIIKAKTKVYHRHVLIAALVTARARIMITELAEQYHETAIYCDTDSFITQTTLPDQLIDKNALGKLKPEYENVTMEFFGRKQYRIVEKTEIKQKGVKIAKENHDDFLRDIKTVGGYAAKYKAPSSLKTSLKKNLTTGNKFEDLQRIIHVDKSSREKGLLK